jgi:acetyl-CoA C-acetyltransferase
MKSVMLGAQAIQSGDASIVIAGGMESMSNAPYLLTKARPGHRIGHKTTHDSLFLDGLEDAYTGKLMGEFGQQTADRFSFSREQMDNYAIESLQRAKAATDNGYFHDEITDYEVSDHQGTRMVSVDEQVLNARPEKIPTLRPAFAKDGTITAANSSSISDGAAALILLDEASSKKYNVKLEAKICAYSSHAQKPEEFTLAPIGAIQSLLEKLNWEVNDVDLFEINEAFAVVALQAMNQLDIDHDKINIHGGACAIGHPLGASGTRIIVTLVHALKRIGKRRGIASLCIGGGEATAIAIELV